MNYLTISIPTYNRKSYLEMLLQSIFSQNLSEINTAVFVSDNASTDGTDYLLRGYKSSHPTIFDFSISQINEGADANFTKCLTHPRSKFIWLIGSDDLLEDGSIESSIKDIKNTGECDLNMFGRKNFTSNSLHASEEFFCGKNYRDQTYNINTKQNQSKLENALHSSSDLGMAFTYLSSTIVSRKSVQYSIKTLSTWFPDSCYAHVAIYLHILSSGSNLRIHSASYVLNRCGNDSFVGKNRYLRRIIDYNLSKIFFTVLSEKYPRLYINYIWLLARFCLSPGIAIGDMSRAFRDGGKSGLTSLNAARSHAFKDSPLLRYASMLYAAIPANLVTCLFYLRKFIKNVIH